MASRQPSSLTPTATIAATLSQLPPQDLLGHVPSAQAWGQARPRGPLPRSPTDARALSLRSETVAAEALEPQSISPASSMRPVGTPARHVSTIASPTEASRRRQRSMVAVVSLAPSGSGMRIVTSPDVVASLRSWCPARQASRSAALSWRSAPTRSPASSSSSPSGISSTVLLTSSPRSALGDSSFKDTMGSGMVCLQHASCLGNSNHAGAGRAPLPYLDAIPLSKCARNCTLPHLKVGGERYLGTIQQLSYITREGPHHLDSLGFSSVS